MWIHLLDNSGNLYPLQNNGNYILSPLSKNSGLLAPCGLQDLSSPTRDWSCNFAVGAWSSNHWVTKEFPEITVCPLLIKANTRYDSPSPILVFCQNINVKKCLTVRSIKFEEYNSKKSYQVICTLTVIKITVPGVKLPAPPFKSFCDPEKATYITLHRPQFTHL